MTPNAANTTHRPTPGQRALAPLLILAMILGGILLWLGVPLIWLWVASQMASGTQPTIGPYMLIAVAIPVSMILLAKLLRSIDALHGRITGRQLTGRVQLPWLKSMRAERNTIRPTTALDVIMLATAAFAIVALGVWFLLFAGNSLPTS
jgi:hypothetical protein